MMVQRSKTSLLMAMSWQDIISLYKVYGEMVMQYKGYKERCQIPSSIKVQFGDLENMFVLQFNREVKRLDAQINVLDKEIARRNKLIGVMG